MLVSVADVGYEYADGTTALDTVPLDVHEGEVHAIIEQSRQDDTLEADRRILSVH